MSGVSALGSAAWAGEQIRMPWRGADYRLRACASVLVERRAGIHELEVRLGRTKST